MGRPGRSSSGSRRSSGGSSRRSSSFSSIRSFSRPSKSHSLGGFDFTPSNRSRSFNNSFGNQNRSIGPSVFNKRVTYVHSPINMSDTNTFGGVSYGYQRSKGRIALFIFLILLLILLPFGNRFFNTRMVSNKIDEETVQQYSDSMYDQLFNDESHLLLTYAYLDKTQTDIAILTFGYDSSDLISADLEDYFWECYNRNYNSDRNESEWIGDTFAQVAEEYKLGSTEKLNDLKNFNQNCYEDNLGWIKSGEKYALIDGCKNFYNTTGIQPYILFVDYSKISGVEIQESTAGRVGTVALISLILIVILCFFVFLINTYIKQKAKKQEDLERTLTTPLEQFGDPLLDKYIN